jgi:endogenous inhibitor of DNA gyrase (YacG/DUF329 family)
MAQIRAACADCGLPYYTEENDVCPYCGHEHRADDAHEHGSRPRAPCADCGLPYYTDANEDCPYFDILPALKGEDSRVGHRAVPTPPRATSSHEGSTGVVRSTSGR